VVDLSASITSGCFPLKVDFTDLSTAGSGSIANWFWDFGDGNISSEKNPSYTYLSAGVFDVSLKITNTFGCSSTITKDNLISIADGIKAQFSILSIDACSSPAKVVFDNNSTGSGTLSYQWNFGDGNSSTAASPSHNYNAQGSYRPLLTVQSTAGCSDTFSLPVNISFPKADFSSLTTACSGQEITFTNNSVPDAVSQVWYFGDGTTSSAKNPVKIFAQVGTYQVKLVNYFAADCKDSITKTITVISGPQSSFSTLDTASCTAPYTVHFTNHSSASAISFIWYFGDGATSSEVNPVHIYNAFGNYTVKLRAINMNGCEDTFVIASYIKIQPVKITGFDSLPTRGCIPLVVAPKVKLNTQAKIVSYSWDFGDGFTSTLAKPVHTYTTEGFFSMKLTIVTENGCTATYKLDTAVAVGYKPHADFVADKTEICAHDQGIFRSTSTNGPIHFYEWEQTNVIGTDSIRIRRYYDTGIIPERLIVFRYGCTDTVVKNIIHVNGPVAKIFLQKHCDNKLMLTLGDSSIADTKWKWDFGDGTTSTIKILCTLMTQQAFIKLFSTQKMEYAVIRQKLNSIL